MSTVLSPPSLLLVEYQFVLRRTIVAVAHDLGIACFKEVTDCDFAVPLLAGKRFDGIVLDGSVPGAACDLVTRLRDGAFASQADIKVIVMTPGAHDLASEERFRGLESVYILRKPFKVAELFHLVRREFGGPIKRAGRLDLTQMSAAPAAVSG